MKGSVVSVNRGAIQVLHWRGKDYETAFIKTPLDDPVDVGPLGLEGDEHATPAVHGGKDKAVYLYPWEHYEAWKSELKISELPAGSFGENLTVTGIDERDLELGDVLQIGEVQLRATEPRLPCVKLSVRFDRADMPKRLIAARRSGSYTSVETEGPVAAGDSIHRVHRSESGWSVRETFEILADKDADPERIRSLSKVPWLSERTRGKLINRLQTA